MALVRGYLPSLSPLQCQTDAGKDAAETQIKHGSWWAQDSNIAPVLVRGLPVDTVVAWVLDSLTLATEHGRVDDRAFVRQLFDTEADLFAFLALLSDNAELHERHRTALVAIGLGPMMETQGDLRWVVEDAARGVRW